MHNTQVECNNISTIEAESNNYQLFLLNIF